LNIIQNAVCLSPSYHMSRVLKQPDCDTAIKNGGALASDQTTCNTACQGNSTETCGGSYRLTVFQYGIKAAITSSSTSILSSTSTALSTSTASTATPSGGPSWQSLGCYVDSVGSRTLLNAVYGVASVMTNELCQSSCLKNGYTYAGTEYSGECYCDTAIRNGGALAPDGNTYCNMACNGNAAEICGGGDRLSMYAYVVNSASNSTTSSSVTTSISGTSASASSSVVATPTSGWTSMGCYNDSVGIRTLSTAIYGNGNIMTIELCQSQCKAAGWVLAGVEYGGECCKCHGAF